MKYWEIFMNIIAHNELYQHFMSNIYFDQYR